VLAIKKWSYIPLLKGEAAIAGVAGRSVSAAASTLRTINDAIRNLIDKLEEVSESARVHAKDTLILKKRLRDVKYAHDVENIRLLVLGYRTATTALTESFDVGFFKLVEATIQDATITVSSAGNTHKRLTFASPELKQRIPFDPSIPLHIIIQTCLNMTTNAEDKLERLNALLEMMKSTDADVIRRAEDIKLLKHIIEQYEVSAAAAADVAAERTVEMETEE
jgi:hypothetical protein